MNRKQYLETLEAIGLTPASRETAEALGISVRHCQRYASGERPIPQTMALLLAMYERHGMPVYKWPPEWAEGRKAYA